MKIAHFVSLRLVAVLPLLGILWLPVFTGCSSLVNSGLKEPVNLIQPPNMPTSVGTNWKKKRLMPGCDICEATFTATPAQQGPAATSYDWQVWTINGLEIQRTTTGRIWVAGYIEPTNAPYTIKVRAVNASGKSEFYSRNFSITNGCCVQ